MNQTLNLVGLLSVKAKKVCLLRYGNRLVMTPGYNHVWLPLLHQYWYYYYSQFCWLWINPYYMQWYSNMYMSRKMVMVWLQIFLFCMHTVKKESRRLRVKSLALSIDYLCVWLTVVLVLLNTTLILCCNNILFWIMLKKYWAGELISEYSDIDFQLS